MLDYKNIGYIQACQTCRCLTHRVLYVLSSLLCTDLYILKLDQQTHPFHPETEPFVKRSRKRGTEK